MLRTIWRSLEILLMLLGVLGIAIIAMHVQDGAIRSAVVHGETMTSIHVSGIPVPVPTER